MSSLSDEKRAKIWRRIEERTKAIYKNKLCECCMSGRLMIADGIFAPALVGSSTVEFSRMSRSEFPVVFVVCTHCGETRMFSLGGLDLMEVYLER